MEPSPVRKVQTSRNHHEGLKKMFHHHVIRPTFTRISLIAGRKQVEQKCLNFDLQVLFFGLFVSSLMGKWRVISRSTSAGSCSINWIYCSYRNGWVLGNQPGWSSNTLERHLLAPRGTTQAEPDLYFTGYSVIFSYFPGCSSSWSPQSAFTSFFLCVILLYIHEKLQCWHLFTQHSWLVI